MCGAGLLVALAHRYATTVDASHARAAAYLLLFSLEGLQLGHFDYFQHLADLVHSRLYVLLLYCVGPGFHFYCRKLLTLARAYRWMDSSHLSPFVPALFLPYRQAVVIKH
ncbi:MAG: hypothetical protein ACRERV_06165 [Methylococcales bacterium]